MPATDLKIIGTRACLPWCGISSSFQVWRRLGIEVISFWSIGVGIWSHSCLISNCWRVRGRLWHISLFNNVPNFLYRWKIWTAARSIKHLDSSTEPCYCNSCSMCFCIVLLKYTRPSWKRLYAVSCMCVGCHLYFCIVIRINVQYTCEPLVCSVHRHFACVTRWTTVKAEAKSGSRRSCDSGK